MLAESRPVQQKPAAVSASGHIYAPLGRFARGLLRTLSPRYRCLFQPFSEPCVYVCRHLNMHGPMTTVKWLPMELHPFALHVFTDKKLATEQFRTYTFSRRIGREPRRFSLAAWIAGSVAAKLVCSLQPVPVHRDSTATSTMRTALRFLLKKESLIIWPDVHYTDGYDKPCEIYRGFLYLGELYYRKTGQELPFIPLYVNDADRTISAGVPLVINDYKQDVERTARELESVLDGRL